LGIEVAMKSPPMQLISLDYDGVLHPARDDPLDGHRFICLPTLAELLEPHPDVLLAVHSTWRYTHKPQELGTLMGALGERLCGVAPRGPREESLLWPLQLLGNPAQYLVLDDSEGEFAQIRPPTLVICDGATGISASPTGTAVFNAGVVRCGSCVMRPQNFQRQATNFPKKQWLVAAVSVRNKFVSYRTASQE
jgi:hypothetical protein